MEDGHGRPPSYPGRFPGQSGCSLSLPLLMAGVDYRYELRGGEEVLATGRLFRDEPLTVGDRLEVGGKPGVVRSIEPMMGERELRFVLQLLPADH